MAFLAWGADGVVRPNIVGGNTEKQQAFVFDRAHVAALQREGREVFVSVGGGNAGALDCAAGASFTAAFVQSLLNFTDAFGFDGVDFDIEHRRLAAAAAPGSTYAACADVMGDIVTGLKSRSRGKLLVSVTPQMLNLNPLQTAIAKGKNEYAPFVSAHLASLDTVAVQMYNSYTSVEGAAFAAQYATMVTQRGFTATEAGRSFAVKVPASKLVLGFPAFPAAATQGFVDPTELVAMVGQLRASGVGVDSLFTWSIGWDQRNDWAFAKAVDKATTDPSPPTPPPPPPTPAPARFACNWDVAGEPNCVAAPAGWATFTECTGVCLPQPPRQQAGKAHEL